MPNEYKFTWYDSKRSWSQFFKDLKFYIKYKLSSGKGRPELARKEEFHDTDPIPVTQTNLKPMATPNNRERGSRNSGGHFI